MARFHGYSEDGSILPLLVKLQREGHQVSMRVKGQVGKGIVPLSGAPAKGAIVIFDHCGKGEEGERLRKAGHMVIGGNLAEHELETDRPHGARIMRQAGIKTPPTFPFTTIKDAIAFLEAAKGDWFVKVSGSQASCASTYNAPPDGMIRYLEWVASKGTVPPFELQQKVEGVEVSCDGWFDGEKFIPPFDVTLEEKRALAGDLGVRTGCESCVVWHAQDFALADRTVAKVEEQLYDIGYVGPIDLNSIVADDGEPFGLEWTARLGFDSTQAWMRLFSEQDNLGEQLEAFANGELDKWQAQPTMSATLRVSLAPYPIENEKELKGMEGFPLDDAVAGSEWVDPVDVKVEGGRYVVAGQSSMIATVGATGMSLSQLRIDLLRRARELGLETAQYRTDPLSRVNRDLARLEQMALAGLKGWKA